LKPFERRSVFQAEVKGGMKLDRLSITAAGNRPTAATGTDIKVTATLGPEQRMVQE
jgi:hypothetical protein